MNKVIYVKKIAGDFAENKDVARDIRVTSIIPSIRGGKGVTLDFEGVTGGTQSFIHALISDVLRQFGDDSLDLMVFKNCSPTIKELISTVVEYMQES